MQLLAVLEGTAISMEEEKKTIRPDEQKPFQPGEKGFAIFLLVIGLFFTWQSVLLYQKAPGASSCGAVPLFCSALIDLFAVAILITDRKKHSVNSGLSLGAAARNALHHLVSLDILVMAALVLIYCIALYVGAGFMLATPVFLWAGMTYLSRGNYVKNLLWTALCMLFIYLVFRVLFSVILP